MSTGVICGSVPHLSPLFRRYKPNLARVGSLFYLLFRSSYFGSKESSALPLHEIERGDSDPYAVHEGRIETKVLGSIEGYVILKILFRSLRVKIGESTNLTIGMANSLGQRSSHRCGAVGLPQRSREAQQSPSRMSTRQSVSTMR